MHTNTCASTNNADSDTVRDLMPCPRPENCHAFRYSADLRPRTPGVGAHAATLVTDHTIRAAHPHSGTVLTPVPSIPCTQAPAWTLPTLCVPGRSAALGTWTIDYGWWGQWAKSEVWPFYSHFLNSWGLGKTQGPCAQCTGPEM